MTTPKIWEWAESCNPENVTEEQAWQLFGLLTFPEGCVETGRCKRPAICKNNPYCLAGITPAALFKSIKDSKKELDKLKEINEQQRADNEYVGLDNLGATCYVNSYLQMWFHTAPFRHLILSYKPGAAAEKEQGHDDSIESTIHQMRVLFAQMLLTKKRSLLPEAFIETLGLDPNNQQDAQEFSNLWMGILQHRFGTSFSRLFCGSCDVSTVCAACNRASRKPDEFAELILNVPAAEAMATSQIVENSPSRRQSGTSANLEDVMRRYFGDETLDGDNAYECVCGVKGKATRRTRLEKAPAILNAQVLRFAFDAVKLQRRKLRTLISFPEHLELRREFFAPNSPELKSVTMPRYRIKAILCHIGTSVLRGHYTARIRLRDGWYIFNDAVVKKGDPTSGGDGGVDADESGTAGGRRFRSADAYCIVYHRVDAPELGENDDLIEDANIIPDDLRAEVGEAEERFRSELEKKRDDIMASSDAKERLREDRLRIRREMTIQLPQMEESPTVPEVRHLLSAQKGGGVVFAHREFINDYFNLKTLDDPSKAFGCGEEMRCDHGRMSVIEASRLKVIPRATADMVLAELNYPALAASAGKSLALFTPDDICLTCVRLECFDWFYRARAMDLVRDIKVELKQIDNGLDNVTRKHFIIREMLEKFGDLAKESITEAENHLRKDLESLSKYQPNSSPTKQQISAVKSSSSENQTAEQFFGTQKTSSSSEAKVSPTKVANNAETMESAGVRDIPPVLMKGNMKYTAVGKGATSRIQPRSESPNAGPTPVKRAKMSPTSNSMQPTCKCEPFSSGDEDQPIANGRDESIKEQEQDTDNDLQLLAAIQASLNDAAIDDSSFDLPHESCPILPVVSELSRDLVNAYINQAFCKVETNINDRAVCAHGRLWLSAGSSGSGRKSRSGAVFGLVKISEQLWDRIVVFFPNSVPYFYPDSGVCQYCEENANNERVLSDKMREEAKQFGAMLGHLAKRTKRAKVDTALRPLYLVTAEFCNKLNDWISGKTQAFDREKKLENGVGLCPHGRLTFLPHELAQEVQSEKGAWVATKGGEYKFIKDMFSIDFDVILKPVIEKKPKDSTSSSGSASSLSAAWQGAGQRSTGSILHDMLTGPKASSRPARISPTSEEQCRLDAVEFKANDASIVVDSSSSETATTAGDEEYEQLTDEEEDNDDDFVTPTPKSSRGRGRGGKTVRGGKRVGGKTCGENAAPAKTTKSRRVAWDCVPGVCQDCRQERIRFLETLKATPEPLAWSGTVYVKMDNSNAEVLTPPQPPPRRRRRVAQASRKSAANAGEEVDYVIESTLPFIEFQMSILEDFEISPFEQMLFVYDEEKKEMRQIQTVENQNQTLGQMQIAENTVFVLKRKEEDEEEEEECAAVSVVEIDENGKKAKSNNRAEGFSGTLLSVLANAAPMKRPISPGSSSN